MSSNSSIRLNSNRTIHSTRDSNSPIIIFTDPSFESFYTQYTGHDGVHYIPFDTSLTEEEWSFLVANLAPQAHIIQVSKEQSNDSTNSGIVDLQLDSNQSIPVSISPSLAKSFQLQRIGDSLIGSVKCCLLRIDNLNHLVSMNNSPYDESATDNLDDSGSPMASKSNWNGFIGGVSAEAVLTKLAGLCDARIGRDGHGSEQTGNALTGKSNRFIDDSLVFSSYDLRRSAAGQPVIDLENGKAILTFMDGNSLSVFYSDELVLSKVKRLLCI